MARVLLTGATGFLGSRVLERLALEHDVTAVARRAASHVPPGVRWLVHDLSEATLSDEFPRRIDVVVHLAQSRHFREFPVGAGDTFAVNVGSTSLLLDWARQSGASKFVLASTGGVYRPSSLPHREEELLSVEVPSFYVGSKVASEVLAHAYRSDFVVVVLRFFFIYGLGQPKSMLIPRLVAAVTESRPVLLQGPGGMRLNPIHVSDASAAVMSCLALPISRTINVAGPEIVSLRQITEIIGAQLGVVPKFTASRQAATGDLVADISAMKHLLGAPRVAFQDGVAELCTTEASRC